MPVPQGRQFTGPIGASRENPGQMPPGGEVGMGEKVRVFIGTEPKTEIARKVLQCSINRRTNADVEYVAMIGKRWEYDHSKFHVGTGFSLRRWMIPEYCNWHGRAIYLDSDQIVLDDIYKLWTAPDRDPAPGRSAWMTYQPSKFSAAPHPQSSVMVIDCAAARAGEFWHLQACIDYLTKHNDPKHYGHLMFPGWMKPMPGKIGVEWNSLNVYAEGKTKLLHYTKEPEQPWYVPSHPLADVWKREFQIALNQNYVTHDEVREAIKKFAVKEDWRQTNGLHPDYIEFIKDMYGRKTKK